MTKDTPDLLDVLLTAYRGWLKSGKVLLQDNEVELKLPAMPVGVIDPRPSDQIDDFCSFVRAYLKLNPVVSTGSAMGAFGVVLADRRHTLFVRDAAVVMEAVRSAVPITGVGNAFDRLPPGMEIPITTGK